MNNLSSMIRTIAHKIVASDKEKNIIKMFRLLMNKNPKLDIGKNVIKLASDPSEEEMALTAASLKYGHHLGYTPERIIQRHTMHDIDKIIALNPFLTEEQEAAIIEQLIKFWSAVYEKLWEYFNSDSCPKWNEEDNYEEPPLKENALEWAKKLDSIKEEETEKILAKLRTQMSDIEPQWTDEQIKREIDELTK